jgi:hypothetical protein
LVKYLFYERRNNNVQTFFITTCSSGISFASMINGIAITVNDEPITLYDIEKTMSVNKIAKMKQLVT